MLATVVIGTDGTVSVGPYSSKYSPDLSSFRLPSSSIERVTRLRWKSPQPTTHKPISVQVWMNSAHPCLYHAYVLYPNNHVRN